MLQAGVPMEGMRGPPEGCAARGQALPPPRGMMATFKHMLQQVRARLCVCVGAWVGRRVHLCISAYSVLGEEEGACMRGDRGVLEHALQHLSAQIVCECVCVCA